MSRVFYYTVLVASIVGMNTALAGWPEVEYAEVRAYYYQPESNGSEPILTDGNLHPSVVNKQGTPLDASQVKRLIAALDGQATFTEVKCYRPHHALIFYDRNHKPVAVAEVCLDCMRSRITPNSKGRVDYRLVADLLEELKFPLGPAASDAKIYRANREA